MHLFQRRTGAGSQGLLVCNCPCPASSCCRRPSGCCCAWTLPAGPKPHGVASASHPVRDGAWRRHHALGKRCPASPGGDGPQQLGGGLPPCRRPQTIDWCCYSDTLPASAQQTVPWCLWRSWWLLRTSRQRTRELASSRWRCERSSLNVSCVTWGFRRCPAPELRMLSSPAPRVCSKEKGSRHGCRCRR